MKNFIKISLTLIFTIIIVLGFTLPANMPAGNWYQQFLPTPTGGQIRDIEFTDSLTGFMVTDSSILKTTNGGDNWIVKQSGYYIFNRIIFLNTTTGFASGGNNTLLKTINSGENWTPIILPSIFPFDMGVVSQDSIWLVNTNGLTGGVYRTTNGGTNWQNHLNIGSQNPDRIYMINGRIGFISRTNTYTRKTTNSGLNWFVISSGSGEGFYDMYFSDTLTGYGTFFNLRKTTNGGANWTVQTYPSGGNIITTNFSQLAGINKDTVLGISATYFYPNSQLRGIIYRTTDGGNNWLYQIPDTSIVIASYSHISFVNKNHGWVYRTSPTGIHTTNGGDPTWITPVNQISTEVPKNFDLHQNYPNPFNPTTNIKYQISNNNSDVKISVFDATGKHITDLVNQTQNAGTYQVDFDASTYSSGVYFYKLTVTGKEAYTETKKMMLIK